MHKSVPMKFIAILLCAACLLTAVVSGVSVLVMAYEGLYAQTPESVYAIGQEARFLDKAYELGRHYTINTYSNLKGKDLEWYYIHQSIHAEMPDESLWYYRIFDKSGNVLESRYDEAAVQEAQTLRLDVVRPVFPMVVQKQVLAEQSDVTAPTATEDPLTTEPTTAATVPETVDIEISVPAGSEYLYKENYYFWNEDGEHVRYLLKFYTGRDLVVELYLLPGAYTVPDHWSWDLIQFAYAHRYLAIYVALGGLLLFALLLVYLCCVAGRKPKSDEVRPAGLNRLPLDLYLGAAVLVSLVLAVVVWDVLTWEWFSFEPIWMLYLAAGVAGYLCALLIVGVLFAFAAQVKVPGCWWLKHTAVGAVVRLALWILKKFFRGVGKLFGAAGGKMPDLFGKIKQLTVWLLRTVKKIVLFLLLLAKKCMVSVLTFVGKSWKAFWRWLVRFLGLLPLTWQWLLVSAVEVALIAVAVAPHQSTGATLCCIGAALVIVMYCAHCFGILLESTKRMSQGDLSTQVDDKLLLGSFQEYATHLNALAGVATEAAKQQMKSERMKAELVTNVSHDIKTPLTSIINYVDLLQKAKSQEEAESYLEVLERQSQRLKKLIEDLMEMSKASTGNMVVELKPLDAVEAVNQALGEFSEKLEQAQLTPVITKSQEAIMVLADGRLTWRVLSNLLGNAVKYAMPGTRLYIGLLQTETDVQISLKNISREQLNVNSEELMERFVRGDASRNTEGSGLGLNIARSLMELQTGQLQLLVDGDLFKATLIFPNRS